MVVVVRSRSYSLTSKVSCRSIKREPTSDVDPSDEEALPNTCQSTLYTLQRDEWGGRSYHRLFPLFRSHCICVVVLSSCCRPERCQLTHTGTETDVADDAEDEPVDEGY